jgi:hypothetical protein
MSVCSDNTPFGGCSLTKPFYCSNGTLIEKCSICGCGLYQLCQNEKCIVACGTNQDCKNLLGQNYKCESGKCVVEHAECSSDSDCSDGKYCDMGICQPIQKREIIETPTSGQTLQCIPAWNCSKFSECKIEYSMTDLLASNVPSLVGGKQESVCVDLNGCNVTQIRSISCTKEVPIRVVREIICSESYIEVYSKDSDKLLARMRGSSSKDVQKLDIDLSVTELNGTVECAHCSDGIKNYDETSIDCGGSDCNACEMPAPMLYDLTDLASNLRWWIMSTLIFALIVYLYIYLFIPLIRPSVVKFKDVTPFKEAEFPEITFTPSVKTASTVLQNESSEKTFKKLFKELRKVEEKTRSLSFKSDSEDIMGVKKKIEQNLSRVGKIIKEKKKIKEKTLKTMQFENELQDTESKLLDLDKKFRLR